MKRTPKRTQRQLALTLTGEPSVLWPTPTQVALVAALADLLIEAHGNEQGNPLPERHDDEPEDQR
jgi:hypothetical protein